MGCSLRIQALTRNNVVQESARRAARPRAGSGGVADRQEITGKMVPDVPGPHVLGPFGWPIVRLTSVDSRAHLSRWVALEDARPGPGLGRGQSQPNPKELNAADECDVEQSCPRVKLTGSACEGGPGQGAGRHPLLASLRSSPSFSCSMAESDGWVTIHWNASTSL